jgi:acyl carrier protein
MSQTVTEVTEILASVLGIEDRAQTLTDDTPLLGAMPELDSLAVVELITVLSERYGFDPDDVDLAGDSFDTIGTLAAFVDNNTARAEH